MSENSTEEAEIREFLREYWELAREYQIMMTHEDQAENVLRAAKIADKIVDRFQENAEDAWKYRDLKD